MKDMTSWNGHIMHIIMACKWIYTMYTYGVGSLIPETSAWMRHTTCIIIEEKMLYQND